LAKHDEISSTEKLLDLIRDNKESGSEAQNISPVKSYKDDEKKSFLNKKLSFKKDIVIGISIESDNVKMVKVNRLSEKKHELLDYIEVPFQEGTSIKSPQFEKILNSALSFFCGGYRKKIEIWSAFSSDRVELRYLKIPAAAKKQIANAAYWTFKKKTAFDEKEEIFDFEILNTITENSVKKIEVMAYSVLRKDVKELQGAFLKSGYPLTGISIVPFAIQNMLRSEWLEKKNNICSLFIGKDWSRIAIFSDGNLVLERGIKSGIKSMIEAVRQEISQRFESNSSSEKDPGSTKKRAEELFFNFINSSTQPSLNKTDDNTGCYLDNNEVFKIILPSLERLVNQVERTIRHFYIKFGKAGVEKIYISGRLCINGKIVEYIIEKLDLPVEVVDPFSRKCICIENFSSSESVLERDSFFPAMGMALSNNLYTPNFIFTHKDKSQSAVFNRVNRTAFVCFQIILVCCMAMFLWQNSLVNEKKEEKEGLEKQLETYTPIVNQQMLLGMAARTKSVNRILDRYGKKYLGMAVISEISDITPFNIRLLNISAEFGGVKTSDKEKKNEVILEGIIFGDRLDFEATLTGYMFSLKKSLLFEEPYIQKKSFEFYEGREVLCFTAHLKLV